MQAHRKGGKLIEGNLPDFGWKLESAGLIFGKETLEIFQGNLQLNANHTAVFFNYKELSHNLE